MKRKNKRKAKGNIKRRRFLIKKNLQLHFGLITFCLLMISSLGVWMGWQFFFCVFIFRTRLRAPFIESKNPWQI